MRDFVNKYLNGLLASHPILVLLICFAPAIILMILLRRREKRAKKSPYISVAFNDKYPVHALGKKTGQISYSKKTKAVLCISVLIVEAVVFFKLIEVDTAYRMAIGVFMPLTLLTLRRKLIVCESGIVNQGILIKKIFLFSQIEALEPIFSKSLLINIGIAVFDGVSYNITLKNGKRIDLKLYLYSGIERLATYLNFADNPCIANFRFFYAPKHYNYFGK